MNAAAFALAAALVPGFSVASFWAALLGALVVSLVSRFIGAFLAKPGRVASLGSGGARSVTLYRARLKGYV